VGLFNAVFGNKKQREVDNFFHAFTAYTPAYTTFEGGLYEMELVRAVIHSFATACSKLKPEVKGAAYQSLNNVLQFRPNPFMNTSQFIYRVATILSVNNNAFIVPIEDDYGAIVGYFPLLPANCEVMDVNGVAWLRYTFNNGKRAAIEFEKVGVVTQFQYKDDFFGSDNAALKPTMQVIHAQNQGIINALKNSAVIRFLAKMGRAVKEADVDKAREKFRTDNLGVENNGGALVYDAKFEDVKPIDSKPLNVNPAQMKQIQENVFNYFGTNEAILQNKYDEYQWNAYHEGKIAPFALQLSLAMSTMTFSRRELAFGNKITFASNLIQYASNSTRLQMSTQMFDRGLMSINDVMDLWGWEHIEGGQKRYIRMEYSQLEKLHDNPDEPPTPSPEIPVGGANNA